MLLYNKTMGNFINVDFIRNIISLFIKNKNKANLDNNITNIEIQSKAEPMWGQFVIIDNKYDNKYI